MSKKHKNPFRNLNYFEHFLLFTSAVIGFVAISAFASLVDIPIGITSSSVDIISCVITAGFTKYSQL